LKISNEYDTLIWISFAIKHKPQTTVLTVALVVLVAMMFLVPAITDKAMGTTYHIVLDYDKFEGSCCTTHVGDGKVTQAPQVVGYYQYIQWKTAGKGISGDENGYIIATIKYKGHTTTADFGWSNPVVGDNSCVVNIHAPLTIFLKPSCEITQGMGTEQASYCIDGIPAHKERPMSESEPYYNICSPPKNLRK